MAIVDLYSKRQKKLRGEVPDVYTYDEIPEPLRVQVIYMLREALGVLSSRQHPEELNHINLSYTAIVGILRREYGLFSLDNKGGNREKSNPMEELCDFLTRPLCFAISDVPVILLGPTPSFG